MPRPGQAPCPVQAARGALGPFQGAGAEHQALRRAPARGRRGGVARACLRLLKSCRRPRLVSASPARAPAAHRRADENRVAPPEPNQSSDPHGLALPRDRPLLGKRGFYGRINLAPLGIVVPNKPIFRPVRGPPLLIQIQQSDGTSRNTTAPGKGGLRLGSPVKLANSRPTLRFLESAERIRSVA